MIASMETTQLSFIKNYKFINKNLWIFLAIFSALFLNLSFPYPGISLLAWVSLVPIFLIIMTEGLKRVVLSALITGLLFNVVYLFWVKDYKHPASLPGAVIAEMGYLLFAVILSWLLYKNMRFMKEIALPLGWITIDYLKTIGYLAFPWGILGYSQYKNLIIIQISSIFGVWGINFLIVYFNSVLSSVIIALIKGKGLKRSLINVYAIVILCIASLIFGFVKLSEEKKRDFITKRVALIQPNFDPWSPDLHANITEEIELTKKALKRNPDLVVWSESSVPFSFRYYLRKNNKYARLVHNYFASLGKPLLFGSLEFNGVEKNGELIGDFYNVAIFYNRGRMQNTYRKIHLVPFGEWFPYKRLFPFVVRILDKAGAGDFTPGKDFLVFDCKDYRFSALICFEDVFGNLARRFILNGSELLVNVTNDAWTGSPKAEVQHFSISVFRTIENRVSLVRSANGGVTACINPYGRVIDSIALFTTDFLVCDIPIKESTEMTFYSRVGDLLPWLILIFVGSMVIFIPIKKVIDRIRNENNM